MPAGISIDEQRRYCADQISITEERHITVWGLGGFVPLDRIDAIDFLSHNPPYASTPAKMPTIATPDSHLAAYVENENEHRMLLVVGLNRFLDNLTLRQAEVIQAARMAGISRRILEKIRFRCEAFDELWYDIEEDRTDQLEAAVLGRAIEGVTQDVYHQGEVVGEKQVYSDSLASMALQGLRPEKFKQKTATELTGADGGPLKSEIETVHVYLPDNNRNPDEN